MLPALSPVPCGETGCAGTLIPASGWVGGGGQLNVPPTAHPFFALSALGIDIQTWQIALGRHVMTTRRVAEVTMKRHLKII